MRKTVVLAVLCLPLLFSIGVAEETFRIATYNIKKLSTHVSQEGNRLEKLKEVIRLMDADVIGLEEVADRDALKVLFPPSDWYLVIDDDSGVDQDVAVVVRKPLLVKGMDADLDADDENFLFPESKHNSAFPARRDLLCVEVGLPSNQASFFVLVYHAKSRFETDAAKGRATNDARRELAAQMIITTLESKFHEKDFFLLGDFNDNPDDRSLNMLETGDPNAAAGPEEANGPFLLNVTEQLCAAGYVTHGRSSSDIVNGMINTIDPESRNRNNAARGTNLNTGDILFDQILVPMRMESKYIQGSAMVFNYAVALEGNSSNRASDHLPVFVDFQFGDVEEGTDIQSTATIAALLPNPTGEDSGNEQVIISNSSGVSLDLSGWRLRDRAQNEYALTGDVPANGRIEITMQAFSMPLNNSGDEVSLLDPSGLIVDHVVYTAESVRDGALVTF